MPRIRDPILAAKEGAIEAENIRRQRADHFILIQQRRNLVRDALGR
jgi:hypothetical protein